MNTTKTENEVSVKQVIEINNLKKSFGSQEVLKDVSLKLLNGENLVVLGKSGSGKSVLIKCIVRLMNPDGGTIHVLGENINTLNSDLLGELRQKIGFLFQSGALYDSMTVKENLEFNSVHFTERRGVRQPNIVPGHRLNLGRIAKVQFQSVMQTLRCRITVDILDDLA